MRLVQHPRIGRAKNDDGEVVTIEECILTGGKRAGVGIHAAHIHVKVFVGDCVIVFHDSLRLLPAGLAKLCKEFKVEHQKLTETVDHDDITVDNYMSFPQLPKYLENDCKGLYEVLQAFGEQVFTATAQDEFRGSEAYTRQIFEHAFDVEF